MKRVRQPRFFMVILELVTTQHPRHCKLRVECVVWYLPVAFLWASVSYYASESKVSAEQNGSLCRRPIGSTLFITCMTQPVVPLPCNRCHSVYLLQYYCDFTWGGFCILNTCFNFGKIYFWYSSLLAFSWRRNHWQVLRSSSRKGREPPSKRTVGHLQRWETC